MLPHLFEEEQVALPLQRAYFTPAEIGDLISKETRRQLKTKWGAVVMGAFFHVLGSKRAAMQYLAENKVPSILWHVPGIGFKAMRANYRRKMVSHIDSLLAGRRVNSVHKPKRSAAPPVEMVVVEKGAEDDDEPKKRPSIRDSHGDDASFDPSRKRSESL